MKKKKEEPKEKELPGYPPYPDSEDLFVAGIIEKKIDPDDPTTTKASNPDPDQPNEKTFEQDKTGGDLDVPGSELDDKAEAAGAEDEENNYYSLGGDDHEDLEEDKGV